MHKETAGQPRKTSPTMPLPAGHGLWTRTRPRLRRLQSRPKLCGQRRPGPPPPPRWRRRRRCWGQQPQATRAIAVAAVASPGRRRHCFGGRPATAAALAELPAPLPQPLTGHRRPAPGAVAVSGAGAAAPLESRSLPVFACAAAEVEDPDSRGGSRRRLLQGFQPPEGPAASPRPLAAAGVRDPCWAPAGGPVPPLGQPHSRDGRQLPASHLPPQRSASSSRLARHVSADCSAAVPCTAIKEEPEDMAWEPSATSWAEAAGPPPFVAASPGPERSSRPAHALLGAPTAAAPPWQQRTSFSGSDTQLRDAAGPSASRVTPPPPEPQPFMAGAMGRLRLTSSAALPVLGTINDDASAWQPLPLAATVPTPAAVPPLASPDPPPSSTAVGRFLRATVVSGCGDGCQLPTVWRDGGHDARLEGELGELMSGLRASEGTATAAGHEVYLRQSSASGLHNSPGGETSAAPPPLAPRPVATWHAEGPSSDGGMAAGRLLGGRAAAYLPQQESPAASHAPHGQHVYRDSCASARSEQRVSTVTSASRYSAAGSDFDGYSRAPTPMLPTCTPDWTGSACTTSAVLTSTSAAAAHPFVVRGSAAASGLPSGSSCAGGPATAGAQHQAAMSGGWQGGSTELDTGGPHHSWSLQDWVAATKLPAAGSYAPPPTGCTSLPAAPSAGFMVDDFCPQPQRVPPPGGGSTGVPRGLAAPALVPAASAWAQQGPWGEGPCSGGSGGSQGYALQPQPRPVAPEHLPYEHLRPPGPQPPLRGYGDPYAEDAGAYATAASSAGAAPWLRPSAGGELGREALAYQDDGYAPSFAQPYEMPRALDVRTWAPRGLLPLAPHPEEDGGTWYAPQEPLQMPPPLPRQPPPGLPQAAAAHFGGGAVFRGGGGYGDAVNVYGHGEYGSGVAYGGDEPSYGDASGNYYMQTD
ncbi:hypothetical protein HYH03_011996 [Edaphochlamys debaryana]|uniref:Uncharacterized protein n=1 Tax=Edaphochlamys debaryana TaxID=47281 RepID=A0A835XZ41_9CHLO|nr:hypothetical protein HYH03_011996 [Edaphochlamys debaryana]|eukprot:KAG2489545.1 hypothetical protein HYH03_011996 [Edaphochlamys debaryana]